MKTQYFREAAEKGLLHRSNGQLTSFGADGQMGSVLAGGQADRDAASDARQISGTFAKLPSERQEFSRANMLTAGVILTAVVTAVAISWLIEGYDSLGLIILGLGMLCLYLILHSE